MFPTSTRLIVAALAATLVMSAQIAPSQPPPVLQAPPGANNSPNAQPGQQQPLQPGQQTQADAVAQNVAQSNAPRLAPNGGMMLNNVNLVDFIDILAKQLKINYILDPAVQGRVSVFTYGEIKPVELMQLLETMLRINNAAMVKVGDIYRIVPIGRISQLPLPVDQKDSKTLPDDERMILNLVFLKYTTATEMANFVKPWLGEGGTVSVYEPANLIIMQDNARSMRRVMDMLNLFDNDTFAGQRVRLFEIENSRPSDLQKELDQVFKAYAMSDKAQSVKFLPVDRINTLIAVAPNPGVFERVAEWIKKLDVAVKTSAGQVNSYVYRLRYARSETIAMAIMALYSNNPMAMMMLSALAEMQNSGGAGNGYGGMNGYGNGGGGGMMGGGMMGGYNPMMMMSMMNMSGGGYPGAYGGYGANPGMNYGSYAPGGPMVTSPVGIAPQTNPADVGLTGQYLQGAGMMGGQNGQRMPTVIPNPFDNTLLIRATPQEYEQILSLLRQLDVAPRQVLVDAKIYEVELTGAFSAGVSAFLEKKDTGSRVLNATSSAAGLTLNTGLLVLRSHELLAAITAAETKTHTRVISAPSIIATDSISASLNVGEDVPVLTSQAVTGVQQGGNSLFSNTVSSRSTGVTLNILARVNSSGIVTLVINQNVSSPQAPAAGGIQSPSFSNRSFQTQLTVQDGDTVAIGGIIQESNLQSSAGVPVLSHLPLVGPVFGAKSISKSRTELVVFLTPRVIYDANQLIEASEEIKSGMKRIGKLAKDDQ
jgi:general secretion pathway protein D